MLTPIPIIKSLREKGFFHLLSANFLTRFLGFGSILIVAKFLMPVELGEIKILQSYSMLFIILAGFGINTAVLKICSENRTPEDRRSVLRLALGRSVIPISIAFILLASLSLSGVLTTSTRLSFWLMVYAIIIPFAVFTDILTVFLQAQKRTKEMAKAQSIIKAQSVIIVVMCTWQWGFQGFVFATIFGYAVGLIPLLWQVKLRFLSARSTGAPPQFFNIALFSVLANGMVALSRYADIVLLDHFCSDREEIGYYSLATIFVLGAIMVTSTVQSIATPYFSARAHDRAWFREQLIKNQKLMVAVSLAVAVAVYGAAQFLVHLVYGSSYESSLTYLAVLLIRYVLWSSHAIIGVALLGLGLVRYNFIVVLVSTPIGVTLSYILLQRFGVIGVAWGQVSSALVSLLIILCLCRNTLRQTSIPV